MKGLEGFKQEFLILAFTVPRMMAALTISPFFGPQFIQGLARQVVTIALIFTVLPLVKDSSLAVVPGARKDAWLRAAATAIESRAAEVLTAHLTQ